MSRIVDKYDKDKFIQEEDNIIRAVGGDGTLLKAIKQFKHLNKPFYGVAKGTVNFLMNHNRYACPGGYEKNYPTTKSTRVTLDLIKVRIDIDGTWKEFEAFNEVYIGAFNGWIEFNCQHSDDILGTTKGAGLIISTSQGSTAMNKNSGGAILPLSSKDWSVLTNQCNRNFNYVLNPKPIMIEANSRNSFHLCVDGQIVDTDKAMRLQIIKGSQVELIFDDYQNFKRKRR